MNAAKKRTPILYSFIIILQIAWATPTLGIQPDTLPEHQPDELLVRFAPGVNHDTMKTLSQSIVGATYVRQLQPHQHTTAQSAAVKRMNQWCVIELPTGTDLQQASNQLTLDPQIEYVEYNYAVELVSTPNDTRYPSMWNLENNGQTGGKPGADIDAPQAWDISTGNPDIVVAVIDTGVDYNHPDLSTNIWTNSGEIPANGIDDDNNGYIDDIHGYDFINNDGDPIDDHGHGTHVAGTIAAKGNNALGVVGVAWQSQVMVLKFLGANGRGLTSGAIDAIQYATKMGARLSNNSWSGGARSAALIDAIAAADEAGILFVAAAGNRSINTDIISEYPASYKLDNIISVAATDHNDHRADFSNYGSSNVDLGAPGQRILSTAITRSGNPPGYRYLNGTSMASPHVSGAAALILSAFPNMNHRQVKDRILNTVDPIAELQGITVTGGRLNIAKALSGGGNTRPAAIDDLAIDQTGSQFVRLAWTSTELDNIPGMPSYYDIRYSTSPITGNNFPNAKKVNDQLITSPPGTAESYSVTGLANETHYYFAIKIVNSDGNLSGLSNIVSATTLLPARPDYVINDLQGPTEGFLGKTIEVSHTVCNNSLHDAPDMNIGFYLLHHNNVNSTGRRIGEQLVPALSPEGCANDNTTLHIPANLPAGNYYLGANADDGNMVEEQLEDNNTIVANMVAVADYIDLTITAITGTVKIAPGGIIRATNTVCSLGNRQPGHSYAALYLSEDAIITTDDTLIDTHSALLINADSCVEGSYWGILPVHKHDTYYLGSIADYRDEISEGDETNNTSAPLAVIVSEGQADLVVNNAEGPSEAVLGSNIAVSVDTCNKGIRKSGDFVTHLYLSTNTDIDTNDTLIGSRSDFLYNEHCNNSAVDIIGTIPKNLAIGPTYYLGVITDAEHQVDESDETNNKLAGNSINIKVPSTDLTVKVLSGPENARSGDAVTITGTICNEGSGPLSAQFGEIYLSSNKLASPDDRRVGWQYSDESEEQCTDDISNVVEIPADLAPGQYYWRIDIDTTQSVQETSEDNNSLIGNPINISAL